MKKDNGDVLGGGGKALSSAIRKLQDGTSKTAHLSPAERDAVLAALRVMDADVVGGGRHE